MNTKSIRHMLSIGAILTTFAAVSFAEGNLKASVGFPFYAQGQRMDAGVYAVHPTSNSGGIHSYIIRNVATQKATILTGVFYGQVKKNMPSVPSITFQCDATNCDLKRLWDGNSAEYSEVNTGSKRGSSKGQRFVEIALK